MAERFNPHQEGHERNPSDTLHLRGRLQLSTARDALLKTGANPNAEKMLTTLLDLHSQFSYVTDQNDLMMFTQGGEATTMKTAIVTSLQKVVDDPKTPEYEKEASRTLHELLTEDNK